ncbi:hypothetical protein KNO81_12370 [Paraburkholderia sediminicola]|nr:hypothetical protein [Paraburkholderia sediminicola]
MTSRPKVRKQRNGGHDAGGRCVHPQRHTALEHLQREQHAMRFSVRFFTFGGRIKRITRRRSLANCSNLINIPKY